MRRWGGKLGTDYDLQGCRKHTFIVTGCGAEDGERSLSHPTALKDHRQASLLKALQPSLI